MVPPTTDPCSSVLRLGLRELLLGLLGPFWLLRELLLRPRGLRPGLLRLLLGLLGLLRLLLSLLFGLLGLLLTRGRAGSSSST